MLPLCYRLLPLEIQEKGQASTFCCTQIAPKASQCHTAQKEDRWNVSALYPDTERKRWETDKACWKTENIPKTCQTSQTTLKYDCASQKQRIHNVCVTFVCNFCPMAPPAQLIRAPNLASLHFSRFPIIRNFFRSTLPWLNPFSENGSQTQRFAKCMNAYLFSGVIYGIKAYFRE